MMSPTTSCHPMPAQFPHLPSICPGNSCIWRYLENRAGGRAQLGVFAATMVIPALLPQQRQLKAATQLRKGGIDTRRPGVATPLAIWKHTAESQKSWNHRVNKVPLKQDCFCHCFCRASVFYIAKQRILVPFSTTSPFIHQPGSEERGSRTH